MQDGKKQNQRDIVDMKVKALTDVLELQQKLSTVMNQMKHLENSAVTASASHYHHPRALDHSHLQVHHQNEYESSSQFSNFGSSLSKTKRNSFKIEDFNKSLQQDIELNQSSSNQQNLKHQNHSHQLKNLKSLEIENNNRDKSNLRRILDGNDKFSDFLAASPFNNQMRGHDQLNQNLHLEEIDKFSIQEQVISSVFPKKALKKDSEEY